MNRNVASTVGIGLALAAALIFARRSLAAEDPNEKLTVAVLPCETTAPEARELTQALPELLSSALSRNEKLHLVEREQLNKVLAELEMGQSGVVDPSQTARLGKLLGARALVTEKAIVIGKQLVVSAKVISVETGRLKSASKTTSVSNPDSVAMAKLLAEEITDILKGDLLKGSQSDDDKLKAVVAQLKKDIGNLKKPSLTVVVPEEHLRRHISDPAVKTQLQYILRKLGFKVIESESEELSKWVKEFQAGKAGAFPEKVGDVEVVIFGAAFSESEGMVRNFYSCQGRLELTAVNVKTKELLAVDRKTASAADLSEGIAAKAALEGATTQVAGEFIKELAQSWDAAQKEIKKEEKKEEKREEKKEEKKKD